MKPEFKPGGLSPWLPLIHCAKLPPEACVRTQIHHLRSPHNPTHAPMHSHTRSYTHTHKHRSMGPTLTDTQIQTPLTLVQTEPLKTHSHRAAHKQSYTHTSTTHVHMDRDTLAMCSHTPNTPALQLMCRHLRSHTHTHTHKHCTLFNDAREMRVIIFI